MEAFLQYLRNPQPGAAGREELERIVSEYPWFVTARIALSRLTGTADPALRLRFMFYPVPSALLEQPKHAGTVCQHDKNAPATLDVIDRFLEKGDVRIRPKEETATGEDISVDSVTEDPDLVSEELAEIYLNQGLKSKAREIYAKLSLLYPKKSVYFAEIIHRIDCEKD